MATARHLPDGRLVVKMLGWTMLSNVALPLGCVVCASSALEMFTLLTNREVLPLIASAVVFALGLSCALWLAQQTWEFDRSNPTILVKHGPFVIRQESLTNLRSVRLDEIDDGDTEGPVCTLGQAFLCYSTGQEIPVNPQFGRYVKELRTFTDAVNSYLSASRSTHPSHR